MNEEKINKLEKLHVVLESDPSHMSLFSGDKETVMGWIERTQSSEDYLVYDDEDYQALDRKSASFDSHLVDKFYEGNPETEELVPDATHLANGMVVLTGESSYRVDLKKSLEDRDGYRARMSNRWCRISHLKVSKARQTVSFIGTYADRTQRKFDTTLDGSWFVKKNSMVRIDRPEKIEKSEPLMEILLTFWEARDKEVPFEEAAREAAFKIQKHFN